MAFRFSTFGPLIGQFLCWSLLLACLSCEQKNKTTDPQPVVCQVLSTTYKVDNNNTLTDQITRTFSYSGTILTTIAEINTDRQASFRLEYNTAGLITKATDPQLTITLETNQTTKQITRATTTKSGVTQSIFDLTYDATNRLTRLTETRQVRPTGTQTKLLTYSFTYNTTGAMLTEKLRYTLIDDSFVEQETTYTYDDGASAYAQLADPTILALIALSQQVEQLPGRFWHKNALKSFQTYNVSTTGTRTTLRDSATFVNTVDANKQLSSQAQTTLSYFTNPVVPIIRKNQYTFAYLCK